MPRGIPAPIGSETVAQNGYIWVRTERGMRYKHHVVAEQKFHREIDSKLEMVFFIDGDKNNFDPANIDVKPRTAKSPATRRARIEAKIEELQAELEELGEEVS